MPKKNKYYTNTIHEKYTGESRELIGKNAYWVRQKAFNVKRHLDKGDSEKAISELRKLYLSMNRLYSLLINEILEEDEKKDKND